MSQSLELYDVIVAAAKKLDKFNGTKDGEKYVLQELGTRKQYAKKLGVTQ